MVRYLNTIGVSILVLCLSFAGFSARPAHAQTIRVIVDGEPVQFDQPPVAMGGRVLVPLRGVFERLNATVQWNPASNTVTASRGDTVVQLTIGYRQALVNRRTVLLDVPPTLIGGRTLVPLRFVSEALGARVDWDNAARTVSVFAGVVGQPVSPPPVGPVPIPPPGNTQAVIDGTVYRVDTTTSPARLLVQKDDTIHTFEITADTAITRIDAASGRGGSISLDQLRPGDAVRVTSDAASRAILVRVSVRDITGRIDAITSNVIVLTDGQSFNFGQGVRFFIENREVTRDQIRPGMEVTLRLNPQTNRIVAVTAQPLAQPPAAAPRILAFSHDAQRPFRAGAVVNVTLRGTGGGTATFDILGVVSDVPMREVSPGLYQGSYTARQQDNVANAGVLARLRVGGQEAPIVQAGRAITIDTQPPQIGQRYPSEGQTVANARPNIVVQINDLGASGIDTAATRMIVNGEDVTARTAVTETTLAYAPASAMSGRVTVRVVVADRAGNIARNQYAFTIAPASTSLIRSVTVNPTIVRSGDLMTITVVGEPGGQASFRIEGITQDTPLAEAGNQPGVYVGSYAIPGRGTTQDARVLVTLSQGGRTAQAEASTRVTILASAGVAPPAITSPAPGARLEGDQILVRGTAAPGHRVIVRVDYEGSLLVFGLKGTYGEVATTADAAGNWAVRVNRTVRLTNADLTITAVAIDPLGRRSEPATITTVIR